MLKRRNKELLAPNSDTSVESFEKKKKAFHSVKVQRRTYMDALLE
jgi:hypothetical protein